MAAAETARLIASLELQDRNFTRGLRNVEKGVNRVDRKLGAFSGFVNRNIGRALDTMAVKLVGVVGTGLEEMATLEDAATSVAGAIGQVGKGWTITADDVVTAANRIESETDAAFDDKAIVSATETLIRYGKVSEKNLEPAMEVMTDLAARTGDVESAATLLAKALADPAKAAGKLARQGIILTKAQEKQLKEMVKVNDTAGAQAFLLDILADTTKGAAAASAGPYRDALNKLGDAGEDLRRGFVTGLAPAILEVSDLLTTELAKPSTLQTLKDVGKEVGGALKGLIGVAKSLPWETIGASLKLAGTGAKAVLDAFLGLPPWIQTAVLTGWGLNKLTGGALSNIVGSLASGLIKGVLGMNAGVVNINAGVVNGAGGVPGAAGKGGGLLGTAAKFVIPVAIAAVTIGAAKALTDAIDPGFDSRLNEGDRPLGNRDPRRFNRNGQVVANWESDVKRAGAALRQAFPPGMGGAPGAFRPKSNINDPGVKAVTTGQRQLHGAITKIPISVKNAQSIASRENSAQQTELANIKNLTNTMIVGQAAGQVLASIHAAGAAVRDATITQATRNTEAAARTAGQRAAGASDRGASRVVSAIWASGRANRPIIQPTNVIERYTTIVRSGSTSGSRRSGPLE